MSRRAWRGVFFDLDGTLADTVELILSSYRHTMKTHLGEVLPDERWIAGMGTPLVEQLRDFARDDAEASAMLHTYTVYQRRIHDQMVRPFPGAVEVVTALTRSGVCIAVVTSKRREVAERTIEVCGLGSYVEFLVTADDVTRGKPDPEPVQKALSELDLSVTPGEVLFVGDSTHDLKAGRAAGTRTAAVGWGPFSRAALAAERPDYFLDRFAQLLEIEPRA